MTDDRSGHSRLHPDDLADIRKAIVREVSDDLAAIMKQAREPVAPAYPPQQPKPPFYEGRDDIESIAKMLAQAKEDIRRDVAEQLRKAIEAFLTKTQIEEIVDGRFEDLGLPTDTKASRREVGDRIRRILRWEKSANVVLGTAVVSGLGSALYAIAKLIGFNPPPSGTH